MNNVQEEIRRLHFQLKQKDISLLKLKQLVQDKLQDEGGAMALDQAEVEKLIHEAVGEEEGGDIDKNKKEERSVIALLTSQLDIKASVIEGITYNVLFEPKDMKLIIQNHNALLDQLKESGEKGGKAEQEVFKLK
mmetsp:Transcript_16437/g.27878  ORF Transcript_16437/g.27878 Transcript_16437/m.27878 type:complete len:135 (+) Transcript_16437:1805-2209(+)